MLKLRKLATVCMMMRLVVSIPLLSPSVMQSEESGKTYSRGQLLNYITLHFIPVVLCLALDGICIFYVGKKPFSIEARAGSNPQKKKGSTHKTVLNEFEKQRVAPLLISQKIGYDDPLDWLTAKREDANYRTVKFQEPNIPDHFQKIVDFGIRPVLTDYLQSDLLVFDADHAMVAYPLKTLQYAYNKLKTFDNLTLTDGEVRYLCGLFKDNNGPIPEAHKMIRD